jgi:hypothetical protein
VNRIYRSVIPILTLFFYGCADVITAPAGAPSTGPRSTEITGDQPSQDGDPGPQWPVKIHSASADIAMFARGAGTARIEAGMRYQAYHASIRGSATVNDGFTSSPLSFSPQEKHTFIEFQDNQHQATFSVPVSRPCGSWIQSDIQFQVWWQGAQGVWLDRDSKPDNPVWYQDPCGEKEQDEPQNPSTGGGGGDCPECVETPVAGYSWCRVKYWYDMNTNEILDAVVLYCW